MTTLSLALLCKIYYLADNNIYNDHDLKYVRSTYNKLLIEQHNSS